jgi:VanZ family protein
LLSALLGACGWVPTPESPFQEISETPFPEGQSSNSDGGPGWRLLGAYHTDFAFAYELAVASTAAQLDRRLDRLGIDAQPTAWNPSVEVAAIFVEGHGGTCPDVLIDTITIDLNRGLVYPTLAFPPGTLGCTMDLAGSWTFVVALERASLPNSQFTLRIDPDEPRRGELQVTLD